jgi:hypothetical protein
MNQTQYWQWWRESQPWRWTKRPNDGDTLYRINRYLRTEHWGDREWNNYQEETRFQYYCHYWIAFQLRRVQNCPHTIPFGKHEYSNVWFTAYEQRIQPVHLLDVTICRHWVQEGILELDVWWMVQSGCSRIPSYTNDVELDPAEAIVQRRLDMHGFTLDQYPGRQIHTRFAGMHIGWFPKQLSYTCPDVVMTYFLWARPMEKDLLNNWQLRRVYYDMLRHEEMAPPWDSGNT